MSAATERARTHSSALEARIEALGLRQNVRELDALGYTVLHDPVAEGLTDRVCEAILRLAQETEGPAKGTYAPRLLYRVWWRPDER
jgi:hypothetical protein